MRISIYVGGAAGKDIKGVTELVQAADRLGVDCVWSAEAWAQDAVTSLAYFAAKTERIHLGTGIMQISARAPAMTAMTALSLNEISGGRFRLGLGVSGPQVVEGLHGASYAKPLTRLRETVDICRMAFAGEKIQYDGDVHVLPRPGGEGKALRLDTKPANIPIYLATLGPKALEYTGAAADGWLGTSFSPDHADAHFDFMERGAKSKGRSLADIDISTQVSVSIGDDVEGMVNAAKAGVAFQMGAMGSAKTNFYNEAFQRAGYQEEALEIQRLWKASDREAAIAHVPDAMVTKFQIHGTPDMVRERFRTYRSAGVGAINVRLVETASVADRIGMLEQLMDIANSSE
ncbi:MAG: LLM class flavin-dependent oxidoreductase [Alphaproteobacteria bacterium]